MKGSFVELLAVDPRDPGVRLRLSYIQDWGNAILAEETVLPERLLDPDAHNIHAHATLELSLREVEWLHRQTGRLLETMWAESPAIAEFDRKRGLVTDSIRSREAIVAAAVAWRRGGSQPGPELDALLQAIDHMEGK